MYRHQRHFYDATRKFYLLGRDQLIADLHPPTGGRVLEIGCGTGRNLVRAARAWPSIQAYGIDVSAEMLATARRSVAAAHLDGRIATAQADATLLDPQALFGVATFDRIFISYALSMIPAWKEALARACDCLAPGGSLHIVDFGDQAGLPAPFRSALARWLALFSVHPCLTLEAELSQFAAARNMRCRFSARFRRYAFLATLEAGARAS
ncbi:class I SAM-dependent methyltransferase [Methylocapsa sp. S129]|uniref:class I SAM-dependent methyltransferase n=1 Tax=Methylocapsa sp. S129 TaxID=1641869 RepID=UPI00131C3A16